MPQTQTFSSRQSEPTAQMTGEEKVWVAEGSLGLVRAVRATYFFARITAFFTGDAVGCQKTVMLFSLPGRPRFLSYQALRSLFLFLGLP